MHKKKMQLTKSTKGPLHTVMKQLLNQQNGYLGVANLVQPITAAPTLAAVVAWRSIKLLKTFVNFKFIHHECAIGSLRNSHESWRTNWKPHKPCPQSFVGRSKGFYFMNVAFLKIESATLLNQDQVRWNQEMTPLHRYYPWDYFIV